MREGLPLLLCIQYALFLYFAQGIYQKAGAASLFLLIYPLLLLPIILTYLIPLARSNHQSGQVRFYFLLASAGVLRLVMLFASPSPLIDVFTMLKEAPLQLLAGQNPYTATFSPVYPGVSPNYFTYWPMAFISQLPFVLLTGDPRVLLCIADLFSAYLLYQMGKRSHIGELLALCYLFRPNALFIIEQSWLASLEVLLLFGAVYLLSKKKQAVSMGILLGCLTAIKPIYAATLLLFLPAIDEWKRTILAYGAGVALLVLPFFLWDPGAFLTDTITFFTRDPAVMTSVPSHNSLSINTLFFLLTSRDIPSWAVGVLFAAVVLLLVWTLEQRRRTAGVHAIYEPLAASILALSTFYLVNSFSFINYYYSISGFLLLWLALLPRDK